MKSETGPIGLIPGHSYLDPFGARVDGLPAEYFFNRRVVNAAANTAHTLNYNDWCVVDYPGASRSIDAIGPQHKELSLLNCPFALEIHFNADVKDSVNYSVAFYRRGDPVAERLSHMLKEATSAGLNQYAGIKTFHIVDLPDQRWRNLESVMQSPVPLVLFEPLFMSAESSRAALMNQHFFDWLGNVTLLTTKRLRDSLIYESAIKAGRNE